MKNLEVNVFIGSRVDVIYKPKNFINIFEYLEESETNLDKSKDFRKFIFPPDIIDKSEK